MLYTLNLYSALSPLYLNKTGKKLITIIKKKKYLLKCISFTGPTLRVAYSEGLGCGL